MSRYTRTPAFGGGKFPERHCAKVSRTLRFDDLKLHSQCLSRGGEFVQPDVLGALGYGIRL